MCRREFGFFDEPLDEIARSGRYGRHHGAGQERHWAIDRPEIAVFVGPFVPDRNAVFLEIGDIGLALQEPQQLVDDRLEMQLLGREDRKALGQIETHLIAEDRARAGAGAVAAVGAVSIT
jgi:hypothetical protein